MPKKIIIKPVKTPSFALELCDQFQTVLQSGTSAEVEKSLIFHGNQKVPFSHFFSLEEQSDTQDESVREIHWEGDFSRLHGIGRNWQAGKIFVKGNVGDCLGEQMGGGEIIVTGNAGDAVGRSLVGGKIIIEGNAGDLVGAPAPGEFRGMMGGEIFIKGNAGDRAGERMRRGTIAVQKNVGKHLGKEMLAGSILVFGNLQAQPGVGMKRGTILLFSKSKSLPQFGNHCQEAVTYQPVYLKTLLKHVQQSASFPVERSCFNAWYRRYSCDLSDQARGEILVLADAIL